MSQDKGDPDEIWLAGVPVDYDDAVKMLHDLYAQLPKIECKGKCWDSCTAIEASELERQQLENQGITLPDVPATLRLRVHLRYGNAPRCPALTSWNTCGVYDVRPFVCRIWGAVSEIGPSDPRVFKQAMMCDHGCIPDKVISVASFVKILDRIELLSRAVTGIIRRRTAQEEMDRLLPPAPPAESRRARKGRRK